MIKKIINFLDRGVGSIHDAAYVLVLMATLSYVFSLLRDRLLASTFGAGETLDLYFAAFKIPDLIFITVTSLVSVYALIPFLEDKRVNDKEFGYVIDGIFIIFAIIIFSLSIVGFFATPFLVQFFFSGFDIAGQGTVILYTRILLGQMVLLGFSSLFSSLIQMERRFLVYGAIAAVYNVGIIIGVLFFYPIFGDIGLIYGVVLGSLFHFAIQIPSIFKLGHIPRFTLHKDIFKGCLSIIRHSIPRAVAVSAHTFTHFIFIAIAAGMVAGSISVLSFAENLKGVPLALIGGSYAVAAFPFISRLFSEGKLDEFTESLLNAIRYILFFLLPTFVVFLLLRAHIVRVILGENNFDFTDTRLTAAVFGVFMIAVVFQGVSFLLARAHYASGKSVIPLIFALLQSAFAISFAVLFLWLFNNYPLIQQLTESLFRLEGVEGSGVVLLALAEATAVAIITPVFFYVFYRTFSTHTTKETLDSFWVSIGEHVVASIIMGVGVWVGLNAFTWVPEIIPSTLIGIFLHGLIGGISGTILWSTYLFSVKNKEFLYLKENATRHIGNFKNKFLWNR